MKTFLFLKQILIQLFYFVIFFEVLIVQNVAAENLAPKKIKPFLTQSKVTSNTETWTDYESKTLKQIQKDKTDGWSYIISGALALGGGLIGAEKTKDPFELGVYTLFESMGVASIGYGIYKWKIGAEDRMIYNTLEDTQFSNENKSQFLISYKKQLTLRDSEERWVRGITHGLIATLNFYSASQQSQEGLKTSLNFIGAVNLLAAISFSVDF